MNENTENSSGQRMSLQRGAAWAAAGGILLLPLIAMRFTDEVVWTAGDFAIAGALLFGALGTYGVAARMAKGATYRAGVGLALATAVLLLWANGAVGLTDGPADAAYVGVPAVALLGAVVARFRPRGMAFAMGAAALAQGVIGGVALGAGLAPAFNSAFEVLALTGFFAALWLGAARLFWVAARERSERGAT